MSVNPNRTLTDRTTVDAVAAADGLRSKARLIVDDCQANPDFVDRQFLQCPAGTYVHTFKRFADDARLIIRIDVRRTCAIAVVPIDGLDGLSRATVYARSAAHAGIQKLIFGNRARRTQQCFFGGDIRANLSVHVFCDRLCQSRQRLPEKGSPGVCLCIVRFCHLG